MTDLLNRAAGQVDYFRMVGGDTTIGVVASTQMIDYSRVERVLIGGSWIEIEPGSLSHGTYGHPGGPRLFWTWTTPAGETAGAVANEIGFSPLVAREQAARIPPPQPPPRLGCANPGCMNVVSRRGQHCATCCSADCTCDVDNAVTPEEHEEALFLSREYEQASARENGLEAMRFARMAEEQRKRAALPVREADPVVEVEQEPETDSE